jgi:integrase
MTQGTVRVNNSKGQVDRVVSLSPDVATALRQWHGLQSAAAGFVFPSPMRRQGGLPLGARQIRNRMARYLKLAGITKRYSPHALRHYAAHQLMPRSGCPPGGSLALCRMQRGIIRAP